ncbi:MAG: diaminopimelate epimerase [Legionellaceae bacterium]
MNLHFTKMHGLGNDFIVLDGVHQSIHLSSADIQHLSRRDTGIGFDQCLIVEPSMDPNIDFFYRIYNANGEAVGQCGNGARCLARFIEQKKLSYKKILRVATMTTTLTLHINPDKTVTVNMGVPDVHPTPVPLVIEEETVVVYPCSLGNPHAVLFVADVVHAPVQTLGQALCEHPYFPNQTNVEFTQWLDASHLALRVYERGCGETRACGSGAVAAAVLGRLHHQMEEKIHVNLPGGELIVEWPDIHGPVFLTGPAEFVYEGSITSALKS